MRLDMDEFDEVEELEEVAQSGQDYSENYVPPKDGIVLDFDRNGSFLAKYFLHKFFKDYSLHIGGSIPLDMLYTDRRLNKVLHLSFVEGVDHAHAAFSKLGVKESDSHSVPDHVMLIITTLGKLSKAGIPRCYAGGMLCLYLELVEGIEF